MRLSQSDRRRGFKDADAEGLAYFRQLARDQGMSPGDLFRAESRYLAEHPQWRSEADREDFIRQSVAGMGFDQSFSDAVWDEVASIAETQQFPEVREPAPSIAEDLRRLEEIGDVMRNDRHRYNRENLGDEAVDIRNRVGPEAGIYQPRAVPDAAPARSGRIDEIKGLMRDRTSEYWKGPRAESIQSEYRNLLSGNAGETSDTSTPTESPLPT